MSAASLYMSVTLDLGDVERGFSAMERRAHALGPAFRELKSPLKIDQKTHAKHRTGPFGPWAARKPSTLAAYVQRGKRIPRPLGRLLSAIVYKSTATGVVAESRIAWSEIMQEGGRAGKGARLPARPFLWLSANLLDKAEDIVSKALLAAFGGA